MEIATILLLVIGGIAALYIIVYNIWFKLMMGKRDTYINPNLFVKYSSKTAEENPSMIIHEYEMLINEKNSKLCNLENDTNLTYIWRNKYGSTQSYVFSNSFDNSLLISEKPEKVSKNDHFKHNVLTLAELILLHDKYSNNVAQYKAINKTMLKLKKELKDFKFIYYER